MVYKEIAEKRRRIIMITGAASGIGYKMCMELSKPQYDQIIIITGNDLKQINQILQEQEQNQQIQQRFFVHELDITNPSSIKSFTEYLKKKKYIIDCLINNSGYKPFKNTQKQGQNTNKNEKLLTQLPENVVERIFNKNYRAQINLNSVLIPYLSQDAKIINISSEIGTIEYHGQKIVKRLTDPTLTIEKLEDILQQFQETAKNAQHTRYGFNTFACALSKACLNAYTKYILVNNLSDKQQCYCSSQNISEFFKQQNKMFEQKTDVNNHMYLVDLPYKVNPKLNGKYFQQCHTVNKW